MGLWRTCSGGRCPCLWQGVGATLPFYDSMVYIALQTVLARIWLGKLCEYQWQPKVHEEAAFGVFAVRNSFYRSETKGHCAWDDCLCSMYFKLQPAGSGSLMLPPVYSCCSTGTETPQPTGVQKNLPKLWSSNKVAEGHHWCCRLMEKQEEFVRLICQDNLWSAQLTLQTIRESKNIFKFMGENSFVVPTWRTLNAWTILGMISSVSYLTHFVLSTTIFK